MPIDPALPPPTDGMARVLDKVADLERRLKRAEAGAQLVTVGAGAPGAAVTSKFYVDTGGPYLYVRIAGVYKRTAALV